MPRLYATLLIVAIAPGAYAQTAAEIGIPSLGLVYDSVRGAVRQVVGIPGAATAGPAVAVGFTPSAAVSNGHTLVAASAADGTVRVLQLRGRVPESRVIEGAIAGADRIVLSPSGRAALLCDSKATVVQVITGLPDLPVAGREVHVPELQNADAWKLAVSDDGSRFAIGSGASVWLVEQSGNRSSNQLQAETAVIAFRPSSLDVVALLRDGVLVRITAAGTASMGRIGGAAGLDAVGLQVSPDGDRAFAAYSQGGLAIVEAGAPETALIPCGCTPTGLTRTSRMALYRLNDFPDSPLLFWDASAPRVWFVPAGVPGEEE
jgi:hypothetical protein